MNGVNLARGRVIQGAWHHHTYVIKEKLGEGKVGTVYLCKHKNRLYALKISKSNLSLTSEVQTLKKLQHVKVQGKSLGPSLFDVDDWEGERNRRFTFYVMEYIEGMNLSTFIQKHGEEWVGIFLLQILEQLEQLHRLGYAFGDLKNENIIVEGQTAFARLIDLGGVTPLGQSIKEYTVFYDRAYWYLGKRKAEPSYDLFATAMVTVAIFYPNLFKRSTNSLSFIQHKINSHPALRKLRPILFKALQGIYISANQMHGDLIQIMIQYNNKEDDKQHAPTLVELFVIFSLSGVFFLLYFLMP